MQINKDRLWQNLMELGKIGLTAEGGVTRLSFTEEEKEAKQLVKDYMLQAGLKVREDAIGNLIGRKEGTNPHAPVIIIGSHLDSVFNGGMFDGPAGVLSGIEALHTLTEAGIEHEHPIEVISFTDEEGARFSSGMLGSKALIGELTDEDLCSFKDKDGLNIAEAMQRAGYSPKDLPSAIRQPDQVKSYLELHIEQGKVLEVNDLPVGVVTGIVGLIWLKVTLMGEAAHAGTTPMPLRKDPLTAAASIISFAEQLAQKEENTVATVGRLHVKPGGINIIPSEVEFTLDVRDISDSNLAQIEARLRQYIIDVCEERGIKGEIELLHRLSASKSSPKLLSLVNESIHELGINPYELPSGAGHDAMIMAKITEMVMIFVRSKEGISHNPKEWTDKEDLALGAEVLYKTLRKLLSN